MHARGFLTSLLRRDAHETGLLTECLRGTFIWLFQIATRPRDSQIIAVLVTRRSTRRKKKG